MRNNNFREINRLAFNMEEEEDFDRFTYLLVSIGKRNINYKIRKYCESVQYVGIMVDCSDEDFEVLRELNEDYISQERIALD